MSTSTRSYKMPEILGFIKESNKIEGIERDPTTEEIAEALRFYHLDKVTIEDLKQFVSIYQPDAVIRDKSHLNVQVGNHIAPTGGKRIVEELEILIDKANHAKVIGKSHVEAWMRHVEYETLHPFTDGNGRSGRMLWLWMMGYGYNDWLKFLHTFYYQTLSNRTKINLSIEQK